MKLSIALVGMTLVAHATVASSQSVAVEINQTVGASTENVAAAATQVRVFGDAAGGVRFMSEAAWAARSAGETTHLAQPIPTAIARR